MLRKRDMQECTVLFELINHPDVFPYVREKSNSLEEYIFLTKSYIDAEERGEIISRIITDEYGRSIGTINLFDIENKNGFLGTWLGKPYHGLGYNQMAKELFFNEVYEDYNIENVFMKIRKANIRSIKAAEKLPYIQKGNSLFSREYAGINKNEEIYDLYVVNKTLYTEYLILKENEEFIKEA